MEISILQKLEDVLYEHINDLFPNGYNKNNDFDNYIKGQTREVFRIFVNDFNRIHSSKELQYIAERKSAHIFKSTFEEDYFNFTNEERLEQPIISSCLNSFRENYRLYTENKEKAIENNRKFLATYFIFKDKLIKSDFSHFLNEECSPYFVDCSVHWAVKYFLCDLWGSLMEIDSLNRKILFELYTEITVSDIYYQYKTIDTFHESQEDKSTYLFNVRLLEDSILKWELLNRSKYPASRDLTDFEIWDIYYKYIYKFNEINFFNDNDFKGVFNW
jgi:hypothetical protein